MIDALYRRGVFTLTFLTASVLVTAAAAEPLTLAIRTANLAYDSRTGRPVLAIALMDESKEVFARFSSANIGSKAEMRIRGEITAAPVFREPLLGGSFQISSGENDWTEDKVRAIVDRLCPAAGCVSVQVEIVPSP